MRAQTARPLVLPQARRSQSRQSDPALRRSLLLLAMTMPASVRCAGSAGGFVAGQAGTCVSRISQLPTESVVARTADDDEGAPIESVMCIPASPHSKTTHPHRIMAHITHSHRPSYTQCAHHGHSKRPRLHSIANSTASPAKTRHSPHSASQTTHHTNNTGEDTF